MSATQIYLVEDHPFMRDMLQSYLGSTDGLEVCGLAASAEEALEVLAGLGVDLLLVDVSLPGMDGIIFAEEARCRRPELPCLMLSGHHERTYVERARQAGARGFLRKGDPEEMIQAIRLVVSGGTYWKDA